jgi:hypothetical protein
MAFGNNHAASRPRATFQTAGGVVILFRHPILAYQLGGTRTVVDEVDVSASLQLNSTFLQATPAQDSSHQETLVDGSVMTITNHLLNGQMTVQALQTTGFVGTGDFVACAHLIVASKDNEGGALTIKRDFNGKKRIRVYYGVSIKNAPHEIIAGNSIVPYPIVLGYSGWLDGLGSQASNTKTIWAVGNKYGITAAYSPYKIDGKDMGEHEDSEDYYGGTYYGNNTGVQGGGSPDVVTPTDASGHVVDDAITVDATLGYISGATIAPAAAAA